MSRKPNKSTDVFQSHRYTANQKTGCWEWRGGKISAGYGSFTLYKETYLAHRVAYGVKYGLIPEGFVICHRCDNPSCINPEHLFLGTMSDNIKDRDTKGRTTRGESQHASKLTRQGVLDIRRKLAEGVRQKDVAKQYSLHQTTISLIKMRKNWRHI